MLIGCLSAWKYPARRALCRDTWIPEIKKYGHDVLFLMGVPDIDAPVREHDMLALKCPDSYPTLPQRTRRFFEYALTLDWPSHVLKIDDDTFVCAERLNRFIQGDLAGDYASLEVHPMPYASGGSGYFCTRPAMEIVVRRMRQETGNEDELVGQTLATAGVTLTHRKGDFFQPARLPMPGNTHITGHGKWLTEDMWRMAHRQLVG